jgi:hypothetical protein
MPEVHQNNVQKERLSAKSAPLSQVIDSQALVWRLPRLNEVFQEQVCPVVLQGPHVMGLSPMLSSSQSPINTAPSRLLPEVATRMNDTRCTGRTRSQRWLA